MFERAEHSNLEDTVPLVDATQSHDMYSRATLVFARLRERVGDEAIIRALRQLWRDHAYPRSPATSMDFVRTLKRKTDIKYHPLIDTLLVGTQLDGL